MASSRSRPLNQGAARASSSRQRDEHDHGPGQQGRRRLVGVLPATRPELTGDEGHGDRGQRATGRHLVDDVGEHVDGLVRVTDAAGADAAGEDEGAREPGERGRAAWRRR